MNTLITSACSGIGEALAIACAKRGDTLFLCGHDEQQLELVAAKCRDRGSTESARVVDVRSANAMQEWVLACDAEAPLERVFANAGVSAGDGTEESVRKAFDANVDGCVNTVFPALDAFRSGRGVRKKRQIAILATIAGYAPTEACPSNSATKNCVKTWGLAMREALAPEGIEVNVIFPGVVRSRITDDNASLMPFLMDAPRAATKILKGVDKNVGTIAFPSQMRFTDWALSILPHWLCATVNKILPKYVI